MREKDMSLSLLFDFYADMLTPVQQNIFDLSYNEDLSLSEIAEQTGITRQGVRDALKRAEDLLIRYEEKLGLSARFSAIRAEVDEAAKKIETLLPHTDAEGQMIARSVLETLRGIEHLS